MSSSKAVSQTCLPRGPPEDMGRRSSFVPTERIFDGLRAEDWVPVSVEEPAMPIENRRGFEQHSPRIAFANPHRFCFPTLNPSSAVGEAVS